MGSEDEIEKGKHHRPFIIHGVEPKKGKEKVSYPSLDPRLQRNTTVLPTPCRRATSNLSAKI